MGVPRVGCGMRAWAAACALSALLGAATAQGDLDCTRPPDQSRGYRASPCDCYCPVGKRVNPRALPVGSSITCGAVLSAHSTCEASRTAMTAAVAEGCTVVPGTAAEETAAATTCQLAAGAAGMCTVLTGSGSCAYVPPRADAATLATQCCEDVTTDDALDVQDYCGAVPRGVCDLPKLVEQLESLMTEDLASFQSSQNYVQQYLLTRLDRPTFCSCNRMVTLMKAKLGAKDEVPVAGECIGEFACPTQRANYTCSGPEIASASLQKRLDHAAVISADMPDYDANGCMMWCDWQASVATDTCCTSHTTGGCSLHAFSDMAPAQVPGASACVQAEHRVGDDEWKDGRCANAPSISACGNMWPVGRCSWDGRACSGASSALFHLAACGEEAVETMLLPPTMSMVAELCPSEFAYCQASDGCTEELWSFIGDYGTCTDGGVRNQRGGQPSIGCLARFCPAQLNNCWMPSGTEECTAQLSLALAGEDFGEDRLMTMDHQLLDLFICYTYSQARNRVQPCVTRGDCDAGFGEAMQCNKEVEVSQMFAGHPMVGGFTPISATHNCTELMANVSTAACLACVAEYSDGSTAQAGVACTADWDCTGAGETCDTNTNFCGVATAAGPTCTGTAIEVAASCVNGTSTTQAACEGTEPGNENSGQPGDWIAASVPTCDLVASTDGTAACPAGCTYVLGPVACSDHPSAANYYQTVCQQGEVCTGNFCDTGGAAGR